MTEPILERLERLRAQWREFTDEDEPRLLHWVVTPDEWRMVEAFLTVEGSDACETGDLFLPIEVPFVDPMTYHLDLAAWITREYEAIAPTLAEGGVDTDWTPPPVRSIDGLLELARSFHEHHQPLFGRLALVLVPKRVDDPEGFRAWLSAMLAHEGSPEVRFVAMDYRETEALADIAHRHARRVRTKLADLDVAGAYLETSAAAGRLDTPAGAFRHGFLQMSLAAGEGRMAEAERLAAHNETIAANEGWAALVFAVRFAMGSGYLQGEDHGKSMRAFCAAETTATEMAAAGDESGAALALKAVLGQGGVCVASGAWRYGAERYEAALAIAEATEDTMMCLECHRMASYCHEQHGAIDPAFAHASDALAIGRELDEETRRQTTLPFVGLALERLTQHRAHARWAEPLAAEMEALLGPDWRDLAKPGDVPEPQPVAGAEASA